MQTSDTPYFIERLSIDADADERAIKRAYARELKLIDQETNVAGMQDLRETYEAALFWHRHRDDMRWQEGQTPASSPVAMAVNIGQPAARIDEHQFEFNGAVHEDDAIASARDVFAQFHDECLARATEMRQCDELQAQLRACLDDVRLINIAARQAFEQCVADLLAGGWQRGHEVLFVAALRVFEWESDRRRVTGLGMAGYMIDAAIDQRLLYERQDEYECELQRQLIVRLREPRAPTTGELVAHSPMLRTITTRFPMWLEVITDTTQIHAWQERDAALPHWKRKLKQVRSGVVAPILVAFFVLFAFFSFVGPDSNSAAEPVSEATLVQQGDTLLDDGEYPRSIEMYTAAIEAEPENANAYAGRALAYVYSQDKVHAELDLVKLAQLDPKDPRLDRARGILAIKANRFAEAIPALSHSLELFPGSTYTRLMRARAYLSMDMHEKALADANDVITAEPSRFPAYYVRAVAYQKLGDNVKGLAQADAALAVNDKPAQAYQIAAEILLLFGERKQALAALQRAVPGAATKWVHMQIAELRPRSEFALRRADIAAAIALDPHDARALTMGAELELETGNYAEAVKAFSTAIVDDATQGERIKLVAGRSIASAKQGDTEAAASDLKLAVSMSTTAREMNNLCWYLGVRNAALDTALASCDLALAKEPRDAATLDSKGLVLVRLKRYREAIAAYDAALQVRAEQAGSLFGRGMAKHRLGDTKGGEADLAAATSADGGVAEEFADMGIVL